MVLLALGALVLDVRCLGALRVDVLVGRRTRQRGLLDVYGVGLVVFRRHRGDMVLGLARGRKNGWPKPGEMDEGTEVGLGQSVLSNVGPYIPCLFGGGRGHGGESGAGCGEASANALPHNNFLRQSLVVTGTWAAYSWRLFPFSFLSSDRAPKGLFGPSAVCTLGEASPWYSCRSRWGSRRQFRDQLGAFRAFLCGEGVRSTSSCYFNHVPDKSVWAYRPILGSLINCFL